MQPLRDLRDRLCTFPFLVDHNASPSDSSTAEAVRKEIPDFIPRWVFIAGVSMKSTMSSAQTSPLGLDFPTCSKCKCNCCEKSSSSIKESPPCTLQTGRTECRIKRIVQRRSIFLRDKDPFPLLLRREATTQSSQSQDPNRERD